MLTLHIGMPKTGTTSIQSYLRRFPELMLSLPYPEASLGLLFGGERYTADIARRLSMDNIDLSKNWIRMALSKQGGKRSVFSSEFLFTSALDNESDFDVFKSAFSGWDNIKIILYLRHPLNHFPSLISQRVRSGQFEHSKINNISNTYYDYAKSCDLWSAHFHLTVIDFNRVKGDLIRNFCEVSHIDYRPEYEDSEGVNPRLDRNSLELARRINELLTPNQQPLKRRCLINDLAKLGVSGEEITVEEPQRTKLEEISEKQNSLLVGRYLDAPLLEN